MDPLLQQFYGQVIPHSTLMSVLFEYSAPNYKIHRWLKDGQLWSLKKGLYVVSPLHSNQLISLPLVANHLYGPSYVSLEFALFHYGIIPEQPMQVTSSTTKRGKNYENKLGRFSYHKLPAEYYALGIENVKVNERIAYMIASKEKALCDWLVLTPNLKIYSVTGLRTLLLEDMRMDKSILKNFDVEKIRLFSTTKVKPERINLLANLLETF